MPLSISLTRLPHFPPTTAHPLLPPPSLNSLLLPRRKPTPHLLLTQCQPPLAAAELQTTTDQIDKKIEPEFIPNNTRVLLQNLPWTCTADDLRPLLAQHGTVVEIEFSMYNKSRNRGLAFVTMSSHEEACKVIESLEAAEFQGRVLRVNWSTIPKPVKVKGTPTPPKLKPVHNIFVANLAFQARSKDLKEFFNAGNANAVSAEVIFDANRRATGYGFLSFMTQAEAEAAIEAFNDKEFMGRQIRVARSKRFFRKSTKEAIESEGKEEAVESEAEVETASFT